jgi:hypothetical protein
VRTKLLSILTSCATAALHAAAFAQPRPYPFPTATQMPGAAPFTIADSWNGVAPCLASDVPPSHVVLGSAADIRPIDATVGGFSFRGQPKALVDAFQRLTAKAHQSSGPETPRCETVECAARAVFGADRGPELLLVAAAYHFNAVELADPDQGDGGLGDIVKALRDLPPTMFPLNGHEYRVIARSVSQQDYLQAVGDNAGEVIANAGTGVPGVLLRSGWGKIGAKARRVAIVHEVAHEFIRVNGNRLNWRATWLVATDADMAALHDRREAYVSRYAQSSPDEDFAESFAAYRYVAPALKRRAPHRYALLRAWAFNGIEYGAATACWSTVEHSS